MKYFSTMLTVLFIGLKLTGFIDWHWAWVLSPVWISFIVVFVCISIAMHKGMIK